MYKTYFYLLRCVRELNNSIFNSKIVEIYTQEKDKLFIHLRRADGSFYHIIISTNPQTPFVISKEEHRKAKKNVKVFFENFLPDELINIQIAISDRIIKFNLANSVLYFFIRGSVTNVLMTGYNLDFQSFKKIEDEKLNTIIKELTQTKFTNDISELSDSINNLTADEILSKYKFIDKDIQKELSKRKGDWKENLRNIIDEILNGKICVMFGAELSKPLLVPESFCTAKDSFIFNDYSSALSKYFLLFYSGGKERILKTSLEKFIEKEIEKTSNRLNDLKIRIENGSKEKEYSRLATVLLANFSAIKKGMDSIEVMDEAGIKIIIRLDEKLSPQKNIDRLFDKSKAERINYQKSIELFDITKKEYDKLLDARNKIEKSTTIEQLHAVQKEVKFTMDNRNQNSDKEKFFNFRHYLIAGKYHLYVGRDSKNNDLLTTKFAKQNDFWFHARSVAGSHAVLRVENTKEPVPKNILKSAASIAAFHSKAKTSKMAPVSYTFKKYVVKRKDLEPGQVILMKEQVLLVPPEIPNDCEFLEDDF